MSIPFKVKIEWNPEAALPTIAKIELAEADYRMLEQWAGDSELYLHEADLQYEVPCQLSDTAMSADPQRMHKEYALYLLVTAGPGGNPLQELTLSFIQKAKNGAVPEDRVYNPWKNTRGVYLDHQEERARVIVSIEGNLFTRYLYSPHLAKPYYYPLIGPKGKTLIQDGPDDHLHHHGMWWGHDDVNGHRTYHEFRGEGKQAHRSFLAMFGGPVFGQITSLIDWQDENGKLLLQETRSVRIYNLPAESRYVDLCTQLYAVNGDVRFGDTKEGGFPFIRVNEQINGHHTGTITAANGKTGEAEIFAEITEWVDYSGKLFDKMEAMDETAVKTYIEAGIAVFSHPQNDTYASQWFVRDYGPFTPANFHFCGGKSLPNGNVISMRHRVYLHQGNAADGRVQARYEEYAAPLTAQMIR